MFSFSIKKTFFDMWDNLLAVFLINIGLSLIVGLIFMPLTIEGLPNWAFIVLTLFGVVVLNLYIGMVSRFTLEISNYKKAGFKDFFRYFKETWKQSLSIPLLMSFLPIVVFFVISYYFAVESIISNLLGVVVFWTWMFIMPATLYFYPVAQRLKKNNKKALRTCFVLMFDNTAFTIGMTIGTILILGVSFLCLFILPGITTIMLWLQVNFKLRLYKYDYLEENPQANRKRIPWNELLVDDKRKVGKRTLRGTIFPWKE